MNGKKRDWTSKQDKADAILEVIRFIIGLDNTTYDAQIAPLFGDSKAATDFFAEKGNITIPSEGATKGKVAFLTTGNFAGTGGAMILETPPQEAVKMEYEELFANYVHTQYSMPKPSDPPPQSLRWSNLNHRALAVFNVLRYLASDQKEGENWLESDGYARTQFSEVGKIDVPNEVRIVFFPCGQNDLLEKGCLVVEVPPRDDEKVLAYVRRFYSYWGGRPVAPAGHFRSS